MANKAELTDHSLTTQRIEAIIAARPADRAMFESKYLALLSPGGGMFSEYEPSVEEHDRVRSRAGPAHADYTYFAFDRIGRGIKIGKAQSPSERCARLGSSGACDMVLLAVARDGGLEGLYHRHFQEHRIAGEWFEPHDDILAEIERLNAA